MWLPHCNVKLENPKLPTTEEQAIEGTRASADPIIAADLPCAAICTLEKWSHYRPLCHVLLTVYIPDQPCLQS